VHCNEFPVGSDITIEVQLPNGGAKIKAGVNIRPYAKHILKEMSQHFEIVIFTASHSCYANVVLDYLDPKGEFIHHRLFRENCVQSDEGQHVKDLRIFKNRNLKDIILVDNAGYSFGFQITNGIPIIPFYNNKKDKELKNLIPFLM